MYYTFESVDFEKKWGDIRRKSIQNAVNIHKAVQEGQPKITELCFTGGGTHDNEMVDALYLNTNGAVDGTISAIRIPPPEYQ
jgi:predicted secreted protein